ncbi:hypothetical protein KZY59_04365 [Prevotella buccae]|jgi:hypothetical protein|nr:hypothetical protein HMPREF0649_00125 [Segatella buccae D17]EJP31058.1 hypothetical protein HMPREF1146_2631 [Prevotella sp. MSX73]MBS5894279.1 hypothetical protein [Segatella buccae]MBW4870786.1 hypothetical protein [Segatella buccae]
MQMKISNNYILSFCIVALAVAAFVSVNRPLRFDRERKARETAVIERIRLIGQAEKGYLQKHGVYTADFRQLTAEKLLADSLQFIPYSNGQRFVLQATVDVSPTGHRRPLVECSAPYEAYLNGLDENHIKRLIDDAMAAGKFPGVSIGDTNGTQ